MNRFLRFTLLISGLFIGGYWAWLDIQKEEASAVKQAIAVVHPTEGNKAYGVVTFTQEEGGSFQKRGVFVEAKLSGLAPGKHGFHIHKLGNCACADATCAEGHFNPSSKKHGGPDSKERHVGDLGNLVADEQGNAHYQLLDYQLKLNGPNSIIGRSIIVHADEDDLVSQPTGNAGSRIGCGVIGIAG